MVQSLAGGFEAGPATNPTAYLNQNEPSIVLFVRANRAPTSNDRRFKLGTIWVDRNNNQSYQLTNVANNAAVWTLLGPGASDVDVLTADSGGAISPTGGNITLSGGTNITTAGGAVSTITFNLDDDITLNSATLVTAAIGNIDITGNTISSTDVNGNIVLDPNGTGLVMADAVQITGGTINGTVIGGVTPAAGTFTDIVAQTVETPFLTAGTGADLTIEMGDAAGANGIDFTDSAMAVVSTMDSNGNLTALSFNTSDTADNLSITGNVIEAGGTNADVPIVLTPKGTGHTEITTGLLIVSAGNISITGAGTQLQVEGGAATDFIGQATLVAGTVTVANTNIAATDRIFLSYTGGSLTNTGALSSTITPNTSFTIESTNGADGNTVSYFIVRQL